MQTFSGSMKLNFRQEKKDYANFVSQNRKNDKIVLKVG